MKTMEPSRLFVDAQSADQWRQKGFYSVKKENTQEYTDSFLYMLLDHKRVSPDVTGDSASEADDLTCAETTGEMKSYLKNIPIAECPLVFYKRIS